MRKKSDLAQIFVFTPISNPCQMWEKKSDFSCASVNAAILEKKHKIIKTRNKIVK